MNWTLISGIFSALENFEAQYKWSMSVTENASYAEIFYKHLSKGFPTSKKDVQQMFKEAHINTYGDNGLDEEPTIEEMENLLFCVMDSFPEIVNVDLLDKIRKLINNEKV